MPALVDLEEAYPLIFAHAAKARPLGDEGPYKLADAASILPRYRLAVTEFPAPASLPQEVTQGCFGFKVKSFRSIASPIAL
jgi:hypothetical protein